MGGKIWDREGREGEIKFEYEIGGNRNVGVVKVVVVMIMVVMLVGRLTSLFPPEDLLLVSSKHSLVARLCPPHPVVSLNLDHCMILPLKDGK